MSSKAALHKLLGTLFSSEELRLYLSHAREGEEVALALPEVGVSVSMLIDAAIGLLERRGLIDGQFFDDIETARPRRRAEICAVRTLWLPEAKRGRGEGEALPAAISEPPLSRPAPLLASPLAHNQDISPSDCIGEIDPAAEYYTLTLTVNETGQRVRETQTRFVGYADGTSRIELRAASRVDPRRMIAAWKAIGEAPVVIVNSDAAFAAYVSWFGGNAIIRTDVANKWMPEHFTAHPAVHMGMGGGFSSSEDDIVDSSRPVPMPKKRMNILKRDKFRCRICGHAADDAADIRIDVHHIREHDAGGPTLPWNLITLCRKCRDGLGPADHSYLHQKADDLHARLQNMKSLYWDGVRRWRALASSEFAARGSDRAPPTGDKPK